MQIFRGEFFIQTLYFNMMYIRNDKKKRILLWSSSVFCNFAADIVFAKTPYFPDGESTDAIMINRALIRLKVVQLVYAYYHNEGKATEVALTELDYSLNKSYDLYHTLLAFLVEIQRLARYKVDVRTRSGLRPAETDVLVAENRFLKQLAENTALMEWEKKQKFRWTNEEGFVKRFYAQWTEDEVFCDYADRSHRDYEADRELVRKLYKKLVVNNDGFAPVLEDVSLYWNDDKEIIDSFVLKTIKRFDPENGAGQPLLPAYNIKEDHEFARTLFVTTIEHCGEIREMMKHSSRNWDISRMAFMDVIIMQIAIAEIIAFPSIPLNVTFSEYIDIAKVYSTPNSYKYVNGMLNSITRNLQEKGVIRK